MPFFSNKDLPKNISAHLPDRAQTIFRKAFNQAYHQYGHGEEVVFMIAWAAVKKEYKKNEKTGMWVKKKPGRPSKIK
ncbi:MAG TPA: ChaB family protein [Candidatus Saccharimonadales bacterium]|nr:ChaB family protein [Candidatus Saccharimonadales bacterium]